jgi:F-box protein 21
MLAVEEWLTLKYGEETVNSTERSFGALDLFVLAERREGDIDGVSAPRNGFMLKLMLTQILARLHSYVSAIRAAHQDIDTQTPRQKAIIIAEYLLNKGWIGIQDGRHYHSLDHLFLGVSVYSENRNSVPLVSAVIYSFVARQFGLQASPISYPFHVHVQIQSPPGIDLDGNSYTAVSEADPASPPSDATTMYMNPFTQSTPVSYTHLHNQLNFIVPRSTAIQKASYLTPSSPRDLTIRAAHNILAAPQHYSGPPVFPISTSHATYAALFALVILPSAQHPAQLRQHLAILTQHFLEHFDLDVHLFESYIMPLTTTLPDANTYRSLLQNLRRNDSTPSPPKRRYDENGVETENSIVKYHVGQVFRHRMRGYLAVIYGWDSHCRMHEEWISVNRVDTLSRGRSQPFYNVLYVITFPHSFVGWC